MSSQTLTVDAVFEDGVFRPVAPVPLPQHQRVSITVTVPAAPRAWPEDAADVYAQIAADDRRIAAGMLGDVRATWPAGDPA